MYASVCSRDLSRNHISSVDWSLFDHLTDLRELYLQSNRLVALPHGIFGCGPLAVLFHMLLRENKENKVPRGKKEEEPLTLVSYRDLSNNQISTIDERACDHLLNLTTIDLSGNPLACECKLVRLLIWLQDQGVCIKRPDAMLCEHPAKLKNQPLLNVSAHTCGLTYAGCLQDAQHVAGMELVIFSSSTQGPFTRDECNSKCFLEHQRYGGLGQQRECLCSTNSEPNHISESQCSAACSNPAVMKECRWTVAPHVFQVSFTLVEDLHECAANHMLLFKRRYDKATLFVSSSVSPVSLSWDFGDHSPLVNSSTPDTSMWHKYGVPGRYQTQVSVSAGQQETSAQGSVDVILPPRLELHCPALAVANRSLEAELKLVNWGGAGVSMDWVVRKDEVVVARAEPLCLPGSLVHTASSRCFLVLTEEVSWSEARQHCLVRGGDLAVLRTPDTRSLIAPTLRQLKRQQGIVGNGFKVTFSSAGETWKLKNIVSQRPEQSSLENETLHLSEERGVWLGLSDAYSPRVLRWVDGSDALPGEVGIREGSALLVGKVCVSLDADKLTKTHSCGAKRGFVCQFTRQVRVPDAAVFVLGTAVFNSDSPKGPPAAHTSALKPAVDPVELLVFAGLSFSSAGRLSSLEFVARARSSFSQVRFQLLRPQCPSFTQPLLPGCGDLCVPVTVCQAADKWLNTSSTPSVPSPCPTGQQLCLFSSLCLPLSAPCSSDACANCSGVSDLPKGTRLPEYSLVAEVLFTIPAGPASRIWVQEELQDLLVSPGDIIALQHDAGPSGLVQCSSDPSSSWKTTVLLQNHSDWSNEPLRSVAEGVWSEDLVCQIRVLYVGQNETQVKGAFLHTGLPEVGNYSLEVTSDDEDFPVSASCPIQVIPPLMPSVIYPANRNSVVYFLPNQTWVLVKIRSQHAALIGREGSNLTQGFQRECPQSLVGTVPECRGPDAHSDSMFAWVDLQAGSHPGETHVVLWVKSEITEATLEIQARVQEPLRGLTIRPHPAHRVYMPSVEAGTEPTFRWTVDDKPHFTYYNSMLNIIYQNPAVYKLTVTARNEVSMLTEDFNVTVDRMNPMSEPVVGGVPRIVQQGSSLNFTSNVTVDTARRTDDLCDVNGINRFNRDGPRCIRLDWAAPDDVIVPPLTKLKPIPIDLLKMNEGEGVSYRIGGSSTRSVQSIVSPAASPLEKAGVEKMDSGMKEHRRELKIPVPAMSQKVLLLWWFGDGGNRTHQYKPPYDNPYNNQAVIHDDVEYIYSQPGQYTLLLSASNRYENKTCKVDVYVYSILTSVQIKVYPPLLHAQKPSDFEAHPLPSPYGIIYTWNFGDDSSVPPGYTRRVNHTYARSGVYNICVNVNNTISSTDSCTNVIVYEEVEGLEVFTSAPTEHNTPTTISARLKAGNNVTWSFDMGDGHVVTSVEPQIEYTYREDGNYTVNVSTTNTVSAKWLTVSVEVFVLQVLSLEPTGCIEENRETTFQASVSGNASGQQYEWSFGDGSPNKTQYGTSVMTHSYSKSGEYHLALLMSSNANKANFYTRICVQPKVANVSVLPSSLYVKLGEESRFKVVAFPEFNYTYLWDFGSVESGGPVRGGNEMACTFKSPGEYSVIVSVLNNISCINSTVSIEVQQSVGLLMISHDGEVENNLSLHQEYVFKASSDSADALYTWDFGDGTQGNGTNVSHAFNSSGRFNISVLARNEVSHTRSEISIVVLAPITNLSVNASQVNVPLNTSVTFEAHLDQGDGVRYSWFLCDRCTPTQGNPENTTHYTFRSVGTFHVIVTAENDIGTAQASIFIFVQRELEGLQIVADDLIDGCCFATNRLLHLQASLKEGTNMTFGWNLLREHENHDDNLTGKTIDLTFSSPGPCEVILKATNLLGTLVENRTIEFLDPVMDIAIESTPNPVAVNAVANLTVTVNSGTDLHYSWFADGNHLSSDLPSVIHRFTTPGLKRVNVSVSNKVSSDFAEKWISVQEPVSGLTFTATNVTENFVASGDNVSLHGETQAGSNISWVWLLPDGTKANQRAASYIFHSHGTMTVTLNATNDVSAECYFQDFIIQDRIQGLELKASKQIAAVGENVEFTISVASGTSVNFILSISGDATEVLTNQTYVHQFTSVSKYYVNLTAHNQVSSERRTLHIEVMEPVTKLNILDCCDAAIPVGVPRTYVASTPTREPLTILWTFDLHYGHKISGVGKSVTYAPDQPGNLTIFLRAFNSLNGLNVTKVIQVQNSIKSAFLEAQPSDTFVNKTVSFHVGINPGLTPATYQWDFGDGTTGAITKVPLHSHIYFLPGHFVVRVNISNLVSWVTAQVEVNISLLKCDEPEVQVIQAPRLAIWRHQSTLVEANVNLKGCAIYGIEYLWEILTSPRCQDEDKRGPPPSKVPLPAEVNVRRLQLLVPKMSISAGNYTLVFSLSYEGVPLRKAACLQLSVMSKKLVPIIEGGTYRVWSKSQDLRLSGEQSYDPNLDPENQSLLNYHWECVSTSKGPDHCSSLDFGLNPSGPVLSPSGSELEVDVEYSFRLTVSKKGMTPESTTQTVLVQNGRIPMVSLNCVSCKALSRYEISQSSYVYLAGTCDNCHSSHRGRWTATTRSNETLVLDLNSTTTGSDSMHLVLRQGVLRDRESYVFSLHVTADGMDREGVAYIELRPNLPPDGGACSLWAEGAGPHVRALMEKVHFNCSGYTDLDETESPLLYSLLVVRCADLYCEEFCVYKGTSSEHAAFLPPGFSSAHFRVFVSVVVEDHQGASVISRNMSMSVVLPGVPEGFLSLPHWLSRMTDSSLRELLRERDSQRVRELSLALITVLNEYEQGVSRRRGRVSKMERHYRVSVRGNITRALTSLDLSTVSDIQQTSAALAQCTAVSREFVCEECQNSTLDKLESMLEILQTDTRQGTHTPTEIADNILNIMGDLIHQVSQVTSSPAPEIEDISHHALLQEEPLHHPLRVALKAYSLSSVLMRILMLGRVLNEEPLILRGAEIGAVGKRADPQSLLCYDQSDAPECQHFSIPRALNASLERASGAEDGIVQLLLEVEPNPFPFNNIPDYAVSTKVAAMEFRTVNGTQIPIVDLEESQAITVALINGSRSSGAEEAGLEPAGAVNISRCDSVIVRVSARNTNPQAALYVQLNFTVLRGEIHDGNGCRPCSGLCWGPTPVHRSDPAEDLEHDPWITAYLDSSEWPNEYNHTDRKRITLNMTRGRDLDHQLYTFFLSPNLYNTTQDHYLNVSAPCGAADPELLRLDVSVFVSLCQYFSESARQWRTDGMEPMPQTSAHQAVCRTRHLTAFAASLFVPPHAVSFIIPDRGAWRSLVSVLVCVCLLLCFGVAAAVFRKLDQLELRRAAIVPLCGRDAIQKYEIQIKTGWSPGAGTTAHVGMSIHGSDSRSGHRHLDSVGAFTRNSLDIFHIASDVHLGSINRIRIWHDNKEDAEHGDWLRRLRWELQRAVCESHVWLSLWEKPSRSPFTRLQRLTCCSLLLQLCLLANTVWYSGISHKHSRSVPVSEQVSLSAEMLWTGLVSCLLVYPLYLLVFFLFRLSRSKVSVEQLPPQVDQESLEIDDFLENSLTGSSFLMITGETHSEETNIDLPTPSSKSLQRWSLSECDWPDVLTDPSVEMGPVFPPRLKRGQGSRHLGVDVTFNPDEEDEDEEEEEEGRNSQRNKYFSSSDEDLIKRILADGQLLSQTDSDMGDLSSIFGDKTELILLQKMNDPLPCGTFRREPPKTAFTSRTVVTDVCKPRPLPPLCGLAALWVSWAGLIVSSSLTMWMGRSMSEGVALMWLISCMGSFLSSFLILEPLKVLLEAIYFSLLASRIRPEDQDVLVNCPRVERVIQRIPRVRPPQGFALSQAREEARKVQLLHTMLKGFLLYMLLLLVVLLLNYSDSNRDAHRLRLRSQLRDHLHTPRFHNISSREDVWSWLSDSLLPQLQNGRVLMEKTGSVLIGRARLRQLRAQPECPVHGYFPASSWFGCGSVEWTASESGLVRNWSVSVVQSGSVWHWGRASLYSGAGYVQVLSGGLKRSRDLMEQLRSHQWLDPL
ncbi:hypothetical protein DNTS_030211 [Danionella cerebrum]|uniref:Polycystin-1 n=1 Tax=Danionella cerebrum TaxID=2873325 RepID=A0A553Q8A2_9TELE|nr:hypothetical protein DNTS_030211 [Danionella translucida]